MQWFRGGLVFQAHRLLYHSTLGLRVTYKNTFGGLVNEAITSALPAYTDHQAAALGAVSRQYAHCPPDSRPRPLHPEPQTPRSTPQTPCPNPQTSNHARVLGGVADFGSVCGDADLIAPSIPEEYDFGVS